MSCYTCPFADIENRPGNISIGDFWGVEIQKPKFYTSKGVSCCIINNDKGEKLFSLIKDKFYMIDIDEKDIIAKNGNLIHPTTLTQKRMEIYNHIDDDLNQLIKRLYPNIIFRIKRYIINLFPRAVIVKIKQIKRVLSK